MDVSNKQEITRNDGLISKTTDLSSKSRRHKNRGSTFKCLSISLVGAVVSVWLIYKLLSIGPALAIIQNRLTPNSGFDAGWPTLPVGTIRWQPCPNAQPGRERMECGFIIAPLDYFKHSAGVAKVALARLSATKSPRKGMVLFNPGGPGGSGVSLITRIGPSLQFIVGEEYDAIGFDPRGIGETRPSVDCFTKQEYDLFKVNTILDRGFDIAPNLSDPLTRSHLVHQQREAESIYRTQYEQCGRTMGDTLRYMGTSTVARDIDFITRSLDGEKAPINYYGFSYGTILGAYLVNMFPDRLGRVVIDGVADAVAWAAQPSYTWYRDWLGFTEPTYTLFLSECSKVGPSICPLAESQNEDISAMDKRIEDFYTKLYSEPLSVPDASRPGILTQGRARLPIFRALQAPLTWRAISVALSEAMTGNGSALLSATQSIGNSLPRAAVSCNDNVPQKVAPTAEDVIDESLYTLNHVSRFGLSVVTTEPDAGCQFWPVTPPERFNGPWDHTLSYPMLIHSNLLDPVTPLSSGKAIKALLGNSARLVLREGPGHCSLSMPSICIAKVNQQYFKDGTLPDDEYLCGVDIPLFPDPSVRDFSGMSDDDKILMEHLYILSDYFNYPSGATGDSSRQPILN